MHSVGAGQHDMASWRHDLNLPWILLVLLLAPRAPVLYPGMKEASLESSTSLVAWERKNELYPITSIFSSHAISSVSRLLSSRSYLCRAGALDKRYAVLKLAENVSANTGYLHLRKHSELCRIARSTLGLP